MDPNGLHHLTAVAGNPQQNLDFYCGLLGLHLVKQTVNYDDPSNYHLFYGDAGGTPGSMLSFLTDPNIKQGTPAAGQAIAVGFSIPEPSINFWESYLQENGIEAVSPFERFGQTVMGLQGPDGLFLELVGEADLKKQTGKAANHIANEHAIRGLHGVTLAGENVAATGQLLTESLGYQKIKHKNDRSLFKPDENGRGSIGLTDGTQLNGQPGKGTVHHLAFCMENEQTQKEAAAQLESIGYNLTDIEDRYYFQSIFFYAPGGILFELATRGPGFTIDEDENALGRRLCLPSHLEKKRSLIEAELPELHKQKIQ